MDMEMNDSRLNFKRIAVAKEILSVKNKKKLLAYIHCTHREIFIQLNYVHCIYSSPIFFLSLPPYYVTLLPFSSLSFLLLPPLFLSLTHIHTCQ